VFSNPDRRRCDGVIQEIAGVSGIASGPCTVFFDDGFATLCISDTSKPIAIDYPEITTLQFGGRGAFQERSGRTFWGGGFGPVGMVTGMVVASALSAATSKTVERVETVVHFAWTAGRVSLLNEALTPERIAALLKGVVETLRGQTAIPGGPTDSGTLSAQLRELAELHAAGSLSDAEFAQAKQRLLSGPS